MRKSNLLSCASGEQKFVFSAVWIVGQKTVILSNWDKKYSKNFPDDPTNLALLLTSLYNQTNEVIDVRIIACLREQPNNCMAVIM